MDASRRGFLFGRRRPAPAPLRPPWAIAEAAFLDACTRCGKCVDKCPTKIVVVGDGDYPTVDFSQGECTFCGDCVAACADGALRRDSGNEKSAPWNLRAVVGEACITRQDVVCRTCGDSCEARAIRFSPRLGGAAMPEVNEAACTGCGACVAVCPMQAVTMERNDDVKGTGA